MKITRLAAQIDDETDDAKIRRKLMSLADGFQEPLAGNLRSVALNLRVDDEENARVTLQRTAQTLFDMDTTPNMQQLGGILLTFLDIPSDATPIDAQEYLAAFNKRMKSMAKATRAAFPEPVTMSLQALQDENAEAEAIVDSVFSTQREE